MISVLLVDDDPVVRQGLRMRLALEVDVQVVGEAGDGEAALRVAPGLHPDVVVMDVAMPCMDGIAAAAALRSLAPDSAVVILSLNDDEDVRARARAAGAAAFVGKHQGAEALLGAIRGAASQQALP